jgi:hypothetical protein
VIAENISSQIFTDIHCGLLFSKKQKRANKFVTLVFLKELQWCGSLSPRPEATQQKVVGYEKW